MKTTTSSSSSSSSSRDTSEVKTTAPWTTSKTSALAYAITVLGIGMAYYLADGDAYFGPLYKRLTGESTSAARSSSALPKNYVLYESADAEIVAAHAIAPGVPPIDLRLRLDAYVPAMIMVGSFVFFWFILVPKIFPKCRPSEKKGPSAFMLSLRGAHNVFMCLYSGATCFLTFHFLYTNGELDITNSKTFPKKLICEPSFNGTYMMPVFWLFTLSKFLEWVDTGFIVWCGRRSPRFLHLYHHATTFWLFVLTANFPGSMKFGPLLNGFVHLLMYHHYWRGWPKVLVPVITTLQLVQLAGAMWSWQVAPSACGGVYESLAQEHPLMYLTPFAIVPVFFHLFSVYFVGRFVKPRIC